jgi:hypothetical protein
VSSFARRKCGVATEKRRPGHSDSDREIIRKITSGDGERLKVFLIRGGQGSHPF